MNDTTERTATLRENLPGILCMLAFVLILPALDALSKYLTGTLAPAQILTVRFAYLALLLAPLAVLPAGREMRRPQGRWLLLLRGVLIATASIFYVAALHYLDLSTVAAIAMLYPIMVTAVSPFVLGEKVGVIRMSAVAVGFVGALVVIRPTLDGIGKGEALALGAPLCFAAYALLTRKMAGSVAPLSQLFWTALGALIVVGAVAAQDWRPVTEAEMGMMILTGVVAFAVYMLQIGAFSGGEASVVAPFGYLQIVSATLAGWVIWNVLPDGVALAGMALIMAAGVVIAVRS